MDNQTTDITPEVREIKFRKGRSAKCVIAPAGSKGSEIVSQLGLPKPRTVILIVGGADDLDEKLKPQLEQLFSRGIARAALDAGAAIIDGGTLSGVMSLMGEGVADRGHQSPLIGVAPAAKVTYPGGPAEEAIKGGAALEPNHDYFVLVDVPEWGDEVDMLFRVAEELSPTNHVITILVNGGDLAKEEVLRSVRNNWPLIVIKDSERLADEIFAAKEEAPKNDPDLAEIVAEGNIQFFSVNGSPAELRRLVVQSLSANNSLRLAWERFAKYDSNAQRQQNSFSGLLFWTIWLGVLATVLAVLHKELSAHITEGVPPATWLAFILGFLRYVIIVVPITISILVAVSNRFKTGKKWVLLRGSAEAIKREIFFYRTRTGPFTDEKVGKASTTREVLLSQAVGTIARRVSQTEINEMALKPYDGSLPPHDAADESDDGMSVMGPEAYIAGRLDNQLKYFEKKTNTLETQIKLRQWAIYILGGLGTLLAAIEFEVWIAVSTAIATALAAFLEHFQLDASLVKYNQSATDLLTLKSWWRGLSTIEQRDPAKMSLLVESTEKILENELTGWVQRMQDAMEKVKAADSADGETEDQSETTNQAPGQRPPLCLVLISPQSAFDSLYDNFGDVAGRYDFVCERIDPKVFLKEESAEAESIEAASVILIDLSTNEENNYYLTGLLNAKGKKWIGLARAGASPAIRVSSNERIIEIDVANNEQTTKSLAQALEDLGFGPAAD